MKRFIIFPVLFFSIISAFGQEVVVTSSFDTSRIYIGDQLKYTITVDQPANLRLTLPFFKDTICKNIEIISGPVFDSTAVKNGRLKIIQKYLVTSFDSGSYHLNPVFAEMKNVNGLKRFYSEYSQLKVMRVKAAPADTTAKIYDIIKPYRAPVTFGDLLPWILLVVVAGFLIWVAIRFMRKFRKQEAGTETIIYPDPAHVIAFRELEKLREEQLWQKGQIKNYYTRLTEILRQYLENRFGVFSLELTTDETLEALLKTGFRKNGSYKLVKSVLTGADLVKFAKFDPEPSDNESHFQDSWKFVLDTRESDVINDASNENDNGTEERS